MTCQFCNSPESIEGKGAFNCGSYRSEYCGFRSVECQLGEKILKLTNERDDWKNIAGEMLGALQMCMACLNAPPGSAGFISDSELCKMKHWRDIVADAMDKFPGCVVDREVYRALDLPKRQRNVILKRKGLK
jgi:hypothetical protein